jgi:hypothetical protein
MIVHFLKTELTDLIPSAVRSALERPATFLLPQELLDLADLFLNFAGSLFVFAFGFQLGILADFPCDLLEFTRHFVKLACCLVLRAGFHGIPPV